MADTKDLELQIVNDHGSHIPTPDSADWTEGTKNHRMTITRQNRYRWYFQVTLTLIFVFASLGAILFDLAYNHAMTNISTVALPIGTGFAMLHFNVKKTKNTKTL